MKTLTSPIIILGVILAVFGLVRLSYGLGQAAFGKEEEIRQEKLRQAHLTSTARALLQVGHDTETRALLERAQRSGAVAFFDLRREEKLLASAGSPAVSAFSTPVTTAVEAGPFQLQVGSSWSWPIRLRAIFLHTAEELLFLALAGATVIFATEGLRRRMRRPRRENSVRILREVSPPRESIRRSSLGSAVGGEAEAFECTLLRVQLGRARGLDSSPVEPDSDLEEARTQVIELCERYAGTFAGIGGRELICYFRDSGDGHSALTALGAARDFRDGFPGGRAGSQLALTHGFARLVPGPDGPKLVGSPLVELNRLVGGDGEVLVSERVSKFAVPLVRFQGQDKVRSYAGHPDFSEVIRRAEGSRNFAELDGYHADVHLTALLSHFESASPDFLVGAVRRLRAFSCRSAAPVVRDAFKKLLRAELARGETIRISSLLALVPVLYDQATVDEEAYGLFLDALSSGDRRVKSNTVELFIRLFPSQEVEELRPYVKSTDHRISANVLIKLALERFDEKVVRSLYGRVRGGSVAHVASALFAIGEIARHYKFRDPNLLRSRNSFLRLFDEVPFWVKHPNPMVRRQALMAARKLADPALDARLREIFLSSEDPEILALFETVYHWRRQESDGPARRSA